MLAILNETDDNTKKEVKFSELKDKLHFNFPIYILRDEQKGSFEGPLPFISFLRSLEDTKEILV